MLSVSSAYPLLRLQGGPLIWASPITILYTLVISYACYVLHSLVSYPCEKYRLRSSTLCRFLLPALSVPSKSKYSPQPPQSEFSPFGTRSHNRQSYSLVYFSLISKRRENGEDCEPRVNNLFYAFHFCRLWSARLLHRIVWRNVSLPSSW
jgi:hypothetical protein